MTILDLILSISPQRVMIANDFKVCVCVFSVLRHTMFKLKLSQYPATRTRYILYNKNHNSLITR